MKKYFLTVLCILFLSNVSFANEEIIAQKVVFKALEKLKASTETGVNLQRYSELVADAKTEINLYKRGKEINDKFIDKAEGCLKRYKFAADAWEIKRKYYTSSSSAREREGDARMESSMQEDWKKGNDCVDELYDINK